VRHDDVGYYYQRLELVYSFESLAAVGGDVGGVSPARYKFTETLTRGVLVVYNEHPVIGHRPESLAQPVDYFFFTRRRSSANDLMPVKSRRILLHRHNK
jgi:hypothetical protein